MGICNSTKNKNKEIAETIPKNATSTSNNGNANTNIEPKLTKFEVVVNIEKENLINQAYGSYDKHYATIGAPLGEGSYGQVFRAKHLKSSQIRAMKVIKKHNKNDDQEIINEINILKTIDHPKVVKIFEFFLSDKEYYLITEMCSEGELFTDITQRHADEPYKEDAAAFLIHQIFSALFYCHSKNIVHRDLKPENIMIEKREKNDFHMIKLIDFGTAKIFEKNKVEKRIIGSSYYIAPEVLWGSYNEKCDLWSCGVILYILLSGVPPFAGKDEDEIFEKIKIGKFDLFSGVWKNTSKEAKDLIKSLLTKNTKVRLSAEQALNNIWFLKFKTKEQANMLKPEKIQTCLKNIKNYQGGYILQQAALAYLVHNNTHLPEVQDAYRLFNLIDENNDGQITKEEFYNGLKKFHTVDEKTLQEDVDIIFSSIDADNNGFIEYEEFVRAAIDKNKFLGDDVLQLAFRFFDKDGSGEITISEIKNFFFKNEKHEREEDVLKMIVGEVDDNGDGSISFEEFKTMMRKILVK
jgi:calcium-dependent protein kinase